MPSPQDDLVLVQQVLTGDQQALKELSLRLRCVPRQVHALASRYARSLGEEELADAAQDIFLKVWQKLATFRGLAPLEVWTWSITRNHIIHLADAEAVRRRKMSDESEQALQQVLETREERLWSHAELQAALDRLPESAARIIRLHHYDGLRLAAIAELEGIGLATLKTRYYRSLTALREDLLRRDSMQRRGESSS